MSSAQQNRWIAWIGILAYGMLTLASMTGWVLCHERDGRVAIESSVNGVCSDTWQAASNATKIKVSRQPQSSLACQRCLDVPLGFYTEKPALLKAHQLYNPTNIQVTPLLANHFPVAPSLYLKSPALFPNPPPQKPRIHQHLGTVILLI